MVLEPGSQTQPLEQDRKSKKDTKMTPQTIDNREAAPRTSGLRGRVLRTINALRVMSLTRGTPGSASGEPELLQRHPAHQPW